MQGFGGESKRPRPRDYTDFPTLLAQLPHRYPRRAKVSNAPQAIAEVRYEAYVFALARQMRKEYELIARDFVLQIDAPDLALERTTLFQDKTVAEFLKIAEMHVAALNEALAGIPRERVRLHCCWGNYDGPHLHDIPMREILPVLYQAKVGGLSIEFANPRHQHEYAALKQAR